jgi:beta-lactamase regulating signal transducer with metallopeptidase domain
VNITVYLALAAALVLSRVADPVARRLAPVAAAWVLSAVALVAGMIWVVGLGFLALATLGRWGIVDRLGDWSPAVLRAHAPVPVAAGIVSVALLLVAAGSLGGAGLRLARGVREIRALRAAVSHDRCGDLTIVHASEPEAVAVPGWRGSIVVTSGMLQVLEPAERAVLLAHERSHLRSAHWAFRLATRLGTALLPTCRPTIASCDRALERWADEAAASEVGDRHLAARSVAKAALAATDYRRSSLSLAFAEGAVGERVKALLVPRRTSNWTPALLLASLAILAAAALLNAGRELDALFELAHRF